MSAADASSLNLWSALSLLGLILVIIGVVLEGAEAVIWTFSWLRRKRLSIIWIKLPEPHIPRWAHTLDHFGWVILVIGLALETWGHIRVTDITSRENQRLTAKLDSTTQIAGDAIGQAAISESNSIQLSWQVELLRSNNIALEEEMSPRIIDEYLPVLSLKQFAGTKYAIIVASGGDCSSLATHLDMILHNASWNGGGIFPTLKPVPIGISVGVCSTNVGSVDDLEYPPYEAARSLAGELNNENVDAKYDTSINIKTTLRFNGVLIWVGARPTGIDAEIFKQEHEVEDLEKKEEDLTRASQMDWQADAKLSAAIFAAQAKLNNLQNSKFTNLPAANINGNNVQIGGILFKNSQIHNLHIVNSWSGTLP